MSVAWPTVVQLVFFFCSGVSKVTEWPPIWKIAAHSDYDIFSWYKYLIVVFFQPRFLKWDLFLIAPFPDLCLLLPFLSPPVTLYIYYYRFNAILL